MLFLVWFGKVTFGLLIGDWQCSRIVQYREVVIRLECSSEDRMMLMREGWTWCGHKVRLI